MIVQKVMFGQHNSLLVLCPTYTKDDHEWKKSHYPKEKVCKTNRW